MPNIYGSRKPLMQTDNDTYGGFTVRDNPKWRRTYVTRLPNIQKNKRMDSAHRKFKTSGEEYGNFWNDTSRISANDDPDSRAGMINEAPQLGRIPYAELADQDEIRTQQQTRKSSQRYDGPDPYTDAQTAAMKNKRNRDREGNGRDRVNVVQPAIFLPPIEYDNRQLGRPQNPDSTPRKAQSTKVPNDARPETYNRTANSDIPRKTKSKPTKTKAEVTSDNGSGIRIGAQLLGNLNVKTIKRIDLELHTEDGDVISITAVPVYISTLDRK